MHEGHRQRMYEKLGNGSGLYDHEVLEILLYGACPRINTNPLAHALLDRFVTISEVLNARVDELKEVAGVGDAVARYLKIVGLCADRAKNAGNSPSLKTFGDCKKFISLRFKDKKEEYIEVYFLNKAYKVYRIYTYTSAEKSRATVKVDEIARSVALSRPYAAVIAHNHVDNSSDPSDYDDRFTRAVQFVCNMNGATLLDHIIYLSGGDFFSYRDSGELGKIKDFCSWDAFDKWIKTLN